ncbi:MAG: glycosyltransferase [Alphaproteobacteria bacterium]|nr:MAG: glycosyltransferase [Alphaproteobacteria bacterium]
MTVATLQVAPLNSSPQVDVCVPTYNAAATLQETLRSITAQTYSPLKIHISDNASTDSTLAIARAHGDARLVIHAHSENVGGEGNFTRCLAIGEGKYTAIFHADDLYEPEMIARQVAYLDKNPDVVAVFTEATAIDEHGNPIGALGGVPKHVGNTTQLDFRSLLRSMLLFHNFLVCPSLMVRTDVLRRHIPTWSSARFRSAGDVDMWLKLSAIGPIAVLGERLMRYRISTSQYSHINRNRVERADFFLVIDDYLQRPEVRKLLSPADFRHYRWLDRHERVARAMNLVGMERYEDSRALLIGAFTIDTVVAALCTRRGLVTLAGLVLLRLVLSIGRTNSGAALVRRMKSINWR